MVTLDYRALIDDGVDAWNRWRTAHPEVQPDLEAVYLYERSLPGIDLSGVNLSRACLIGADLTGANLKGANLSGVYASTARFRGADLSAAQLQQANFTGADFTQANLAGAATDGANFTEATLTGTCLDGWASQPAASDEVSSKTAPATADSKSPQRLAILLGAGAIALSGTALMIAGRAYLSAQTDPTANVDTIQVALVCNEPALPKIEGDPSHIYADGTQFYGEFTDGQPADGRGTMLYPNGNRYDGEYRGGQRSGCGTFTFSNNRRYVGEFDQDLFSGRGAWTLENGDRYLGEFEYNKCSGEGVYIFADGTTKSGVWQQGRLLGENLSCDGQADDPLRTPAGLSTQLIDSAAVALSEPARVPLKNL